MYGPCNWFFVGSFLGKFIRPTSPGPSNRYSHCLRCTQLSGLSNSFLSLPGNGHGDNKFKGSYKLGTDDRIPVRVGGGSSTFNCNRNLPAPSYWSPNVFVTGNTPCRTVAHGCPLISWYSPQYLSAVRYPLRWYPSSPRIFTNLC